MATQFTLNVGLGYWQLNDRDWHLPYQATCQLLDRQAALGTLAVRPLENPSTSRDVRVSAGSFRKADGSLGSYAGTSGVTIPASSTRHLWLTEAGTLTLGTAWPTGHYVPLATVTTDADTVTSVVDARVAWASIDGGV